MATPVAVAVYCFINSKTGFSAGVSPNFNRFKKHTWTLFLCCNSGSRLNENVCPFVIIINNITMVVYYELSKRN